jgi:hypothetical protein
MLKTETHNKKNAMGKYRVCGNEFRNLKFKVFLKMSALGTLLFAVKTEIVSVE